MRRYSKYIPPKINIEPENDGLEDVFPLSGVSCQVHVKFVKKILPFRGV